MIRTHSRFVSPVNRCLLARCTTPKSWVLHRQPLADSFGVALVGSAQRLLGRETPAFEVVSYGPHRKANAESMQDELPHRLTCPKGKRGILGTFSKLLTRFRPAREAGAAKSKFEIGLLKFDFRRRRGLVMVWLQVAVNSQKIFLTLEYNVL